MRLSRRAFSASLAGATLFAARASGAAPNPTVEDAIARIGRARKGLKSLAGPFTQERTIGLLATKVRSTGRLTLSLPDRLRWELGAPDEITYWVTPEGLAYKSKSGGGRLPKAAGAAASALDDLRILLAGDLGLLAARHELRLLSSSASEIVLEAVPRADAGASAARITIALDADQSIPKRVTIAFGPKDRTEIVFGLLERNGAIPPSLLIPPT